MGKIVYYLNFVSFSFLMFLFLLKHKTECMLICWVGFIMSMGIVDILNKLDEIKKK